MSISNIGHRQGELRFYATLLDHPIPLLTLQERDEATYPGTLIYLLAKGLDECGGSQPVLSTQSYQYHAA